jgi:NDP-sugar pyrophosphorylase family protein
VSRRTDRGGITSALVLAAGMGTRIRAVAPEVPKPLVTVAGVTALERNLRQLAAAGISDVWINLHYRGEQIADRVGDGGGFGLRVRYSWEPALVGTAGAAKRLEAELAAGTFLVISADTLTEWDLLAMVARHRERSAVATIAVFDRDRVANTGVAGGRVVIDRDCCVLRFEEGRPGGSPYVNTSVYLLEPEVLTLIPADSFFDFGHDLFPALIRRGARFDAFPIAGYCLGIDTSEALARAEAFLREREHGSELVACPGSTTLRSLR